MNLFWVIHLFTLYLFIYIIIMFALNTHFTRRPTMMRYYERSKPNWHVNYIYKDKLTYEVWNGINGKNLLFYNFCLDSLVTFRTILGKYFVSREKTLPHVIKPAAVFTDWCFDRSIKTTTFRFLRPVIGREIDMESM